MKTLINSIIFICLTTFSYGQTQGIKIDGGMRQFTMYIPTTIDKEKPVALVLNFHGSGMTALEQMFYTEMNATADKHSFIVVYPQGLDNDWNVGFGMDYDDGPKDVEFIRQLIEKIKKHYSIDSNAIFATGLSRGGFFTHRLAVEMPEVFAAIAPVGAPIPNEVKKRHTSKEKIAVLLAHGDVDEHVKYEGKTEKYNSVEETIAYWKNHNGSTTENVIKIINPIDDDTSVSITTYSDDKDVLLVKIKNGGHTWPGANDFNVGFPLGKTTHDISFNDVMWEFFSFNSKSNQIMEQDIKFLRLAIDVAKTSQQKGNLPYGSILVSKNGTVLLKGENTINTDYDCLAHAEINLIREACKLYDHEFLKTCTIYTSDEPCPMCSSAIYWSGLGKLTYGLSKGEFYNIVGRDNPDWVFEMSARDVLKSGKRKVEVTGPFLESEVAELHIK